MDSQSQKARGPGFTLFVGEGDFSFSANYILKSCFSEEKIYATCLSSEFLSERQKKNIKVIENNDGVVLNDVDAISLESHPIIKYLKFTKIFFNFPHVPGKMNIRDNRKLVQQFFISARKVLEDHGHIFVTLCRGQGGTEIEKTKRKWCDTWQVVSLAASASLILTRVKFFDAKEFETYECTGFRGLQKPFNMDGALTHIFCHGKSVDLYKNDDSMQNSINIELYLKECENLHRIIYKDAAYPSLEILHSLNKFTEKIFPSDQVFIYDLLTCKNSYFSPADNKVLKVDNTDYCDDCLSSLFLNYLYKRGDKCVTSIICNICCVKNIELNKHPFPQLLCYFSDNAKLLTYLSSIIEYFKEEYPFYMNHKDITEQSVNINSINKFVTEPKNYTFQVSPNKERRIKNITNLYVNYLIKESNGFLYYSGLDFFVSCDVLCNASDKCMKIGNIIQYFDNLQDYICIMFNIDLLASLKFHIMDYRILLSSDSYYESAIFCGSSQKIYRSPSIYPPTYVHDISFYTDNDFCENSLFLVIRNTVGYLIKSVTLIDTYYNEEQLKHSRCYRFIYQSNNQALTKENANVIHTQVMRKSLEKALNIILR